jgi:hypothetical protein
VKKHVTQFDKKEHNYLVNRFKSIPRGVWEYNPYSKKRAIKRGVDLQVFNTFWTEGFDLIEYHYNERDKDHRILLRSICTDELDNQVCCVFSLTKKRIITVYNNERTNKHEALDKNGYTYYTADLDVIGFIKSMTKVR